MPRKRYGTKYGNFGNMTGMSKVKGRYRTGGGHIYGGSAAYRKSLTAAVRTLNRRQGGLAGLELKFLDTSKGSVAISSSATMVGGEYDPPTLDCLNSMVQGNGASARIGRYIWMKSIKVKGHFNIVKTTASSAPPSVTAINAYLILDRQTNTAQMSSEDVFTNKLAAADTLDALFRDMQNTDRFQVLDSYKTNIMPTFIRSNVAGESQHAQVKRNWTMSHRWPGKGKRVLFNTAGGNVTNIQDNSLHVIIFASIAGCTVSYNARLRYTTT